jgi:RsiW-degrading membrane proteinase PrsW (M82 family)
VVLTGLVAAAITWPFIDRVIQPDEWLAQSSAITRIIGFTLAVGVPVEITKYLVLRYSIWPDSIRVRMDGLAYSIAASIGLATVANLQTLAVPGIQPGTLAILVFDTTVTGIAAGMFVGYGLAETAIGRPSPFTGPLTLSLAALVHGVAIPLRTGLTGGGFSLAGGSASPLLGVAISLGLIIVVSVGTSFLISASERREREAAAAEL